MQTLPGEIIFFFRERKGVFESRYGVLMKMSSDEESFFTNHQLPQMTEMNVRLRIVMDVDTLHSFITGFKLQYVIDLDRISYNYVWLRYLNGEGAFYAKHCEMKYEIGFRLISFKTIVFCRELNFYAEEHKHLTMPDEFESWVERNLEKVKSCEPRAVSCS